MGSINHINLQRDRERFEITPAHRQALFTHMNSKEKLKINDLYKILGIKKHDGWWGGKAIGNGLQGNTTVIALQNALTGYSRADELLRFELKTCEIEIADPKREKLPPNSSSTPPSSKNRSTGYGTRSTPSATPMYSTAFWSVNSE